MPAPRPLRSPRCHIIAPINNVRKQGPGRVAQRQYLVDTIAGDCSLTVA